MEKAVSSTTFLASPKFLDPVMSLIRTVIDSGSHLDPAIRSAYVKEAQDLLSRLVMRTDLDSSQDKISVEVARTDFGVHLEIINRGTPINFERTSVLDGKFFWKFQNLGRDGQSLSLELEGRKILELPETLPRFKKITIRPTPKSSSVDTVFNFRTCK